MKECCGNCKHFKYEDTTGQGWCEKQKRKRHCKLLCHLHQHPLNGWEEITPDNVVEVYQTADRIVVSHEYFEGHTQTDMATRFSETISTMAKLGGYYYYVLPELKIE